MASIRQQAANQLNAKKSKGPTTLEGKAISRANALKHGLSGSGVVSVPEELEQFETRRELWRPCFQHEIEPGNPESEHLFEQIVVNTLRMDRAQRREIELLTAARQRACHFWEADRQLDAQTLGNQLPTHKNPGFVVARLHTFLQGIEWLIEQWSDLKHVLESETDLNVSQSRRLQSLLGIPKVLQDQESLFETIEALAIVETQLESLQGDRLESAKIIDEQERTLTIETGFSVKVTREEQLNRRYEDLAQRRFQNARKALQASRTANEYEPKAFFSEPAPEPKPQPVAPPPPMPLKPESPRPEPPKPSASQPMIGGSKIPLLEVDSIIREAFPLPDRPARNEPDGGLEKPGTTLRPSNGWDNAFQVRIAPKRD